MSYLAFGMITVVVSAIAFVALLQEAYKLGIKYAIRQIEGTEALMVKAHKELPYANPGEAEREHGNMTRMLATIKYGLVKRYEDVGCILTISAPSEPFY